MNRRVFLASVPAGVCVSLAGCAGILSNGDGDDGEPRNDGENTGAGKGGNNDRDVPDGNLRLGESATHGAVQLTVTDYIVRDEIHNRVPLGGGETVRRTPSSRVNTLILTELTAAHVGEAEQRLPNRGPTSHGSFELSHDGQGFDRFTDTARYPYFEVDGERLEGYYHEVHQATGDDQVYDVEYTGWIGHEIPDDIDPAELELTITWDEEPETWSYVEA